MTFYIKPPAVVATVKNLEDCVEERLTCYANIHCENIKEIIQSLHCLADDSTMDRIGHYLFRMVSHNNSRFRDVYLKNEVTILGIRLNCYGQSQVKFAIAKIRRHAKEVLQTYSLEPKVKQFILLLVQVCTKLLEKECFSHAFLEHTEPCEKCNEFCFKIPFELCTDLVASREYLILKGLVHVYSFQWKHLLLSFFRTYLMMSFKVMNDLPIVRKCLNNEQIKYVMELTETLFSTRSSEIAGRTSGSFKLDSFDKEFKKFPPCMRHLYETLLKNNRLSHNARFNFGKFLKEIGLSVEDAFIFWEQAYSKKHSSGSKCTHNWKENENRYRYSIRHLYGLEGSKRDYRIKSCQQIQDNSLNPNEEGGCLFKHCDVENLGKLLKCYLPVESGDQVEVIIHERMKTTPKKACELFMSEYLRRIHHKEVEQNRIVYQDPADYYLLVKGLTSANL